MEQDRVIKNFNAFVESFKTFIEESKGEVRKEAEAASILQDLLLKVPMLITLQHHNSEYVEMRCGKEVVDVLEKYTLPQDW